MDSDIIQVECYPGRQRLCATSTPEYFDHLRFFKTQCEINARTVRLTAAAGTDLCRYFIHEGFIIPPALRLYRQCPSMRRPPWSEPGMHPPPIVDVCLLAQACAQWPRFRTAAKKVGPCLSPDGANYPSASLMITGVDCYLES